MIGRLMIFRNQQTKECKWNIRESNGVSKLHKESIF